VLRFSNVLAIQHDRKYWVRRRARRAARRVILEVSAVLE
jgi:hypothetical protein